MPIQENIDKEVIMESYFNFRFYFEIVALIIAGGVALIGISFTICSIIYGSWRNKNITKFFKSHGYERKLLNVSSVGGHAFWGWVREDPCKVVDDRDLKYMSLRAIKEKYQ